jgi:solute carrier family 35 protein F1/2
MSTQEILPSLPVRTISSQSVDDDVKRTSSTEDDTKSLTEPQDEQPAVKATPNALDVLLGRDRSTLREDPIIWNKGVGPFAHSLKVRLLNIFTLRFLFCLLAGQALSLCITATSTLTTELGNNGWAMPTFQTVSAHPGLRPRLMPALTCRNRISQFVVLRCEFLISLQIRASRS